MHERVVHVCVYAIGSDEVYKTIGNNFTYVCMYVAFNHFIDNGLQLLILIFMHAGFYVHLFAHSSTCTYVYEMITGLASLLVRYLSVSNW